MWSRREAWESITTRRRFRPCGARRRRTAPRAWPPPTALGAACLGVSGAAPAKPSLAGRLGVACAVLAAGLAASAVDPPAAAEGLQRVLLLDARGGGLRLDPGRLQRRKDLLAGQPLLLGDLVDALLQDPSEPSAEASGSSDASAPTRRSRRAAPRLRRPRRRLIPSATASLRGRLARRPAPQRAPPRLVALRRGVLRQRLLGPILAASRPPRLGLLLGLRPTPPAPRPESARKPPSPAAISGRARLVARRSRPASRPRPRSGRRAR